MEDSVTTKLKKYVKKKVYDTPTPSLILADMTAYANNLTLRGINICLNIHDYISNASVLIHSNRIMTGVLDPYHCHDFYECNYVFEGTLVQVVGIDKYVMEAGDLLVMNPSVYHTSYALPGSKAINVLIREEYLKHLSDVFEKSGEKTFLRRIVSNPSHALFQSRTPHYLDRYFLPLYEADNHFANHPKLGEPFKEALFCQAVADITLNTEQGFIAATHGDVKKADTPSDILQYIKENFASVSRKRLAQKFGYSEAQIGRIIKKHTGFSYMTYITSMRIYTATDLLKNTDQSVQEIAKAVGFGSVEHFCRLYKKHVGYAPLQHKKYMQNELKAAVGVPPKPAKKPPKPVR